MWRRRGIQYWVVVTNGRPRKGRGYVDESDLADASGAVVAIQQLLEGALAGPGDNTHGSAGPEAHLQTLNSFAGE
jgi:hypothetical protein